MRKERFYQVQSLNKMDDYADTNEVSARLEMSEMMETIRSELTPRQFEIFTLYYVDGKTQKEIALHLGIMQSLVSKTLQVIKMKLKEIKNIFCRR